MSDKQEFEHYRFIADKGQNPLRVDLFLLNFVEFASRNKIQNSIKAGNVRINNKIVKANYKVRGEDLVTVVLDYPKEKNKLLPQDIPIDIVYEDDDLLIVNKEAGMVVHPGFGNYSGTAAARVRHGHHCHVPERDLPSGSHRWHQGRGRQPSTYARCLRY